MPKHRDNNVCSRIVTGTAWEASEIIKSYGAIWSVYAHKAAPEKRENVSKEK